jgi:hypothetical protein
MPWPTGFDAEMVDLHLKNGCFNNPKWGFLWENCIDWQAAIMSLWI